MFRVRQLVYMINKNGNNLAFIAVFQYFWRQFQRTVQNRLRLSLREDQAGVIQAITPISMKLGQNERYIKKTSRQSGLALGFFSRWLAHPPHPPPPWLWGQIPQNWAKISSEIRKPPEHRIQTILLSFSLKEDWSFSSLPHQFQII